MLLWASIANRPLLWGSTGFLSQALRLIFNGRSSEFGTAVMLRSRGRIKSQILGAAAAAADVRVRVAEIISR